ncbi:MAG: VIT1/CCC1 transporter family protein [Candidatus Micrarchaeota archaeon]
MIGALKRILSYSRYLTLGLMDASLTSLSVLTATYLSGITNNIEVVRLALSVGVGIAASNYSGAYLAEETEIIKERIKVEKAMGLRQGQLRFTLLDRKLNFKARDRALVNSISAFIGILISTLPMWIFPSPDSYYYSVAISVGMLALLGVYLGKIVNRNVIKSVVKVIVIALVVMVLNLVLSKIST